MPDEFTLLEHPLTGGIDQHTDSRKVGGTLMLRAENARIAKTGRWDKRYGVQTVTTTVLTGSAIASANNTLHKRESQLLVAERSRLLSRSSEKDRLVRVGDLPEFYATDVQVPQVAGLLFNPDVAAIASTSDYTCTVFGSPATGGTGVSVSVVYAIVQDATTGTQIVQTTALTGTVAYSPRVLAIGNVFVLVWSEGANIRYRRLDMSASVPAWDSVQTLRADHTGVNGVFDICAATTAGTWILAYQTGAGAARIVSLYRYDNAAVPVQQATGTTGDAHDADYVSISCIHSSGVGAVGVAYVYRDPVPAPDNDVVRAAYQNSTTLANTVAGFDVARIASPLAVACGYMGASISSTPGATFQVAWTGQIVTAGVVGRTDDYVRSEMLTSGGAVTGTTRTMGGAALMSKLFVADGSTWGVCNLNTQNAAVTSGVVPNGSPKDHNPTLCRFYGETTAETNIRPVTSMAPRVGTSAVHEPSHLSNVVAHPDAATTSYVTAYGELQKPIQGQSQQTHRVVLSKLTLDGSARQSCELGGLTYLTGGIPTFYDGYSTAEVGFLCSPNVTLTASNGAGALDVAAVYQYAIVQVHHDASGNVHRGIPWRATVTMGGADDTVTIDIPYHQTLRGSNLGLSTFEIYRTEGGGTLLRLLSELWGNLLGSGAMTTTDLAADTALASQPFIYDTVSPNGSQQLAHVNPPSATLCMTHRDRVWLAGCPNRKEIWVSSKYTPREAVFFSEAFRIVVDDGGAVTALASLDDKAVVFKSDRVFYVAGDGPDDSGAASDWTPATKITGTVGCIDARSVVVTPLGVMFRSGAGMALLTRGLEVVPDFGAAVEDHIVGRTITSSTLHEVETEVRWLLDNGVEIRYDYAAKAWLTATLPVVTSAPSVSAWCNGTLFYLLNSQLYREDTTTFKDAGTTFVPMTLELAPVSAGGRLGMQNVIEVQCLFDRVQDHDIKIEISADGDSYPAGESKTWDATTLSLLGTEYVLSKKPLKATKGRVMKVRISDTAPTPGEGGLVMGTGAGYRLVACTFKVAVKEGPYKLMGASAKG